MIDVLSMLRATRRERKGDVEQLASRLHAGEQIPPTDILHALADCGATDEDLQAELVRLDRVGRLRADTKAAATARKTLAKLEAEQQRLADRWTAAGQELQQWQDGHQEQLLELRGKINRADRAADDVLRDENLATADRAACEAAAADLQEAAQACSKLRDELQTVVTSLGHAEQALQGLDGQAGGRSLMPVDRETKQQAERLRAKVARYQDRKTKLAGEIAKAEQAVAKAEQAEAALLARIRKEALQ